MTEQNKKIGFAEIVLGAGVLCIGLFHEYLSCAVSAAMLVWLICRGCRNKPLIIYINSLSLSVVCIVVFYGITALWAVDGGMALIGWMKFLPVLLYLLLLFQQEGTADAVQHWLPYLAAAMTIISAIGMQISSMKGLFSVAGRLAGFFQYSNTFALFLLVAELLVLSRERLRLPDYVLIAVLLCGILYSGSRTVFLLTVVSNGGLLFGTKKGRTRLIAAAIIVVLLCGAVGYALLSGGAGALGRLLTISLKESTFVGRLLYFRDALPVILRHPFGLGYMGYYYIQQSIQSGVYSVMFVHNDFLQLLLDVGWIPALLFAAAMGRAIFGRGRPLYKRVILSVMCLHSCFDFDLQFVAVFMLLLVFAADRTGKAYCLSGRWPAQLAAVLAAVCLYFGVALGLAHFGKDRAAYALYPLNTRSETQLLIQESDSQQAERLADDILRRNRYVTVAYSLKARLAYAAGNFAQLIEVKNRIFANAPFAYKEYEEYCYMLITGIQLYEKAGDEASARICRQELRRAARSVHTANSRLSALGAGIQDQPTVELPADIEAYLVTQASE